MEKGSEAKKEATLFGAKFMEKVTKRMEKEKALCKVTGSHGTGKNDGAYIISTRPNILFVLVLLLIALIFVVGSTRNSIQPNLIFTIYHEYN